MAFALSISVLISAIHNFLTTGGASDIDGVYFNPVEGNAGTSWPVGTPQTPVNNLDDTISIMYSRNLKKLYLVGAREFTGTHTAPNHPIIMTDVNNTFISNTLVGLTIFNDTDGSTGVIIANSENTISVATLVGGAANRFTTGDVYHVATAADEYPYRITFDQNIGLNLVGDLRYDVVVSPGIEVLLTGGLNCHDLTNTTGTLEIWGNCHIDTLNNTTGNITIHGHVYIGMFNHTDAGDIGIHGDCHVVGGLINNSGEVDILGDCWIGGILNDSGDIGIHGDCHVATELINNSGEVDIHDNCWVSITISNVSGRIFITGNCQVGDGGLQMTDPAGQIEILGIAHIRGAINFVGTLTYKGVYPEVDVSINATNAAETDFLNLAAIVSFHYTVNKLRLKCVDPGANTVTVRLYELVNGVLTQVDSFDITTVNFATYFSLDEMFGVEKLFGDNLQITVRASAGGPYAVTGEYAYETA